MKEVRKKGESIAKVLTILFFLGSGYLLLAAFVTFLHGDVGNFPGHPEYRKRIEIVVNVLRMLAVISIIGSIGFYKRKEWARRLFNILTLSYILYNFVIIILFFFEMPKHLLFPELSRMPQILYFLIMIIIWFVGNLPALVIVYFLNKKELKEVFR